MATITDVKANLQQWTPLVIYDVVLKDGTPRYWARQAVTFGGNAYLSLVVAQDELRIEGDGVYGVDAVQRISLSLNNADTNLNPLIVPSNWAGGTIQPRFVFVDPDTGIPTTNSIVYPKFLVDLPEETYPLVIFSAHNKWNLARKELPLGRITRRDRYPFPKTATERTAAGSDVASPFFAIAYDPDNAKGSYAVADTLADIFSANTIGKTAQNYDRLKGGLEVKIVSGAGSGQTRTVASKTATTFTVSTNWTTTPDGTSHFVVYYTSYDGTRDAETDSSSNDTNESLERRGLSVRHGGFGKTPPTIIGTPKKGERAEYKGNSNEAKYGQAIPLLFGTVRVQPPVLDTGFPSGWHGARLSHLLISEGINFGPEASMGIEGVQDVFLPDNEKYQRIPSTSSNTAVTGSWSNQTGFFGHQLFPAESKYRNWSYATDFPVPEDDFPGRDLFSGLAYLQIGYPKELSGRDGLGPKTEVIAKGLKVETWNAALISTWQWTQNPVWIFIHLLKLLRWSLNDIDKTAAYDAATYCDGTVDGKARFRCNLALTAPVKAADVLRGIRNNCRMYTSFGADGKLRLKIKQDVAGEGGTQFTLDNTNILRDKQDRLMVKKFHRSITETANLFSLNFQNEDNFYNVDTDRLYDLDNIVQIDEEISADSITAILGIPSYGQARRILEHQRQEHVVLNEYYRVTCSMALIEVKVGQIGTITETRHGLSSQQCRIVGMARGREMNSVELVLKKHADSAYSDTTKAAPKVRAASDSTYTPRSVGAKTGGPASITGNPTLTELFIQDDINPDLYTRKVKVEFTPPSIDPETQFLKPTEISNVAVQTTGGSINGNQTLFVECTPTKSGAQGLASSYLLVNVPAGTNTNQFTFDLVLPEEADGYRVYIGTFPGKLWRHSNVATGSKSVTVTITSISAIDATLMAPDPGYDHARIFYYYDSDSSLLFDGGATSTPTQASHIFEPETVPPTATSITVIVSSANITEDDFYPLTACPVATLNLTRDTGNPSGGSSLVLKVEADDAKIPSGELVFEWARDTVNVNGIYAAMGVLSTALPAQGPYDAERNHASHSGALLENSTGATVVAGQKRITMTRASSAAAVGRVLLIWTADASPDSDLDGNVIESQGTDFVEVTSPFSKGGTFSWAIVKRWWDTATAGETTNTFAKTFIFGVDLMGDFSETNQPLYRTNPVRYPNGSFYGTVYVRNQFGVGPRLTSALKDLSGGWLSNADVKSTELKNYVTGPAPNGTFASFSALIDAANPDSQSSAMDLFWDYTQGTQKATQFSLLIFDGTASFRDHFRAIETAGAQRHRYKLKRLHKDKALTITITPEFVFAGGTVPGTPTGSANWNITPNADSGTDVGGTLVGDLDWAGGNAWFDTNQYRNNLAPTNAPGFTSILVVNTFSGVWTLTLAFTYVQGANIATHFAIYVKHGGGTISQSDPHFMINAGAGTTIKLPIQIGPDALYSFGVAAVAMTRNGPSFHSTIATSLNSAILDVDVALGRSGKLLQLGSNNSNTSLLADTTVVGKKLDFNTSAGIFIPRKVIDANNPPAAPAMTSGEWIIFLASHASVSRWFSVYYDGTNRFYFEAGGTGGTNLF